MRIVHQSAGCFRNKKERNFFLNYDINYRDLINVVTVRSLTTTQRKINIHVCQSFKLKNSFPRVRAHRIQITDALVTEHIVI